MGDAAPAPAVRIEPAGPDAADRLALVGQATFLETFAGVLHGGGIVEHCRRAHAPEVYARWLADPRAAAWLAVMEPGAAPVGYAVLAPAALPVPDPRDDDLELKRIYLLGRVQGGGLGGRLMAEVVARARALGAGRLLLGVFAGNAQAQAFYARSGFVQLGRRSFDVGGVVYDDVVMGLALRDAPRPEIR